MRLLVNDPTFPAAAASSSKPWLTLFKPSRSWLFEKPPMFRYGFFEISLWQTFGRHFSWECYLVAVGIGQKSRSIWMVRGCARTCSSVERGRNRLEVSLLKVGQIGISTLEVGGKTGLRVAEKSEIDSQFRIARRQYHLLQDRCCFWAVLLSPQFVDWGFHRCFSFACRLGIDVNSGHVLLGRSPLNSSSPGCWPKWLQLPTWRLGRAYTSKSNSYDSICVYKYIYICSALGGTPPNPPPVVRVGGWCWGMCICMHMYVYVNVCICMYMYMYVFV